MTLMISKNLIYPELSYKITGLCFKIHKELGRFCRERQYADALEKILKEHNINYKREYRIENENISRNQADFVIDNKIILDLKAKNFVTKEDYFQMPRYLSAAKLELGLIINFRKYNLKPKRILNSDFYSGHSDKNSDYD